MPPASALPSIFCILSFTESWQSLHEHVLRSHLPRAFLSDGDGDGGGDASSGCGSPRMNIETGKSTEVFPASFLIGFSVRRYAMMSRTSPSLSVSRYVMNGICGKRFRPFLLTPSRIARAISPSVQPPSPV